MKWKLPPTAKIYEALTAVAAGRVEFTAPGTAEVASSGGDKRYVVRWSEDLTRISSNDSASKFQGYTGYPIIAVLMKQGLLPYEEALAALLANVPWKSLNDRFKRDYDQAVTYALTDLSEEQREAVVRHVDDVFEGLAKLDLERGYR